MEIRYISKVKDDNVVLSLLTDNYSDRVEKHKVVSIAELSELRKTITIYGHNAVTNGVRVLTPKEVEKLYYAKLKLLGRAPNSNVDIAVDKVQKRSRYIDINLRISKGIEHSYICSKLLVDWHIVFGTLYEILNNGSLGDVSEHTVRVGLTFDIGMYEVLGAVMPFSTFVKDYQAPCSVIIKSIEFSDKFDLRYTKEVRDLFYPLSVLYNSNKIRIYSDATIDLSKYTLERMESMENMFANLHINVKMPEVQTNNQTIFKNIVNRTRCISGKTLYNYTTFAIENTKEGIYGIADDRIIVDSAKLSELADINNLFKAKGSVKSEYCTTVIIGTLVLDCEITEGMFEDIRTMCFVIRNINVTPEFSIHGYSTQVALNLINNFDNFVFSIIKETKKYTAYKMNMSSQDCRAFLKKSIEEGLLSQGIINNFKEDLFCPQNTTDDGEIGFITMVNGASDVCLPIVFMSLIFQGYCWSEVDGYRSSLYAPPYYSITLPKPTN